MKSALYNTSVALVLGGLVVLSIARHDASARGGALWWLGIALVVLSALRLLVLVRAWARQRNRR
jgi:hypothetical protein